jgi:hypothetical protein
MRIKPCCLIRWAFFPYAFLSLRTIVCYHGQTKKILKKFCDQSTSKKRLRSTISARDPTFVVVLVTNTSLTKMKLQRGKKDRLSNTFKREDTCAKVVQIYSKLNGHLREK